MGKNRWHTQNDFLEAQSDFHNIVRDIFLTDSFFKLLKCYQEVPVIDLIPSYEDSRHRFDWYILELNTIIELHGQQHYKPTNFTSGISYNQTMSTFLAMQRRDKAKKTAAQEAGFIYVEIPYNLKGKINAERMRNLIFRDPSTSTTS